MFNDMQYSARNQISNFMYAVYAWVAVGLSLAGGTAYAIASSPAIFIFFMKNPLLLFGIIVVQFMAIMGFSAYLQRMSFPAAMILFILLTASYGFTFSTIFAVYTAASIVTTFVVTAATFLVMATYGYITRADLTSVGSIAMMILFGMIIAMLVNIFVQSQTFDIIISGVGVIIFTLLIAYDSQKIKRIGEELLYHNEMLSKVALLGAFILFLDFINLFLFLLRFLGVRKSGD
jgi:FtsH-binding integral membrane protein